MNYSDTSEILKLKETLPVFDVRTPAEFEEGHIPGATNLPLFSNDDRKQVGTLYKQVGRDKAILKGLELVGPKMARIVEEAEKYSSNRQALMYCWRGGMRSNSMAWLLEMAGWRIKLLKGGYKSYRQHLHQFFQKDLNIKVLGGKTGSGKTDILLEMQKNGAQVIDLEGIAHHKGSAFGHIGQQIQPTTEQFENLLFEEWRKIDLSSVVWLEDESKAIGRVNQPDAFFRQIRNSQVIFLEIPIEYRIERLVRDYANLPTLEIEAAILRIQKRLGGLNTKKAIDALQEKDYHEVAAITLKYYDKAYLKGLSARDKNTVTVESFNTGNASEIARSLILKYN